MATRALKKLTKKDDLKEIQQKFSQIEPADKSEEENESEEESFKPVNKFNLVRLVFNIILSNKTDNRHSSLTKTWMNQ